MQQQPKLIALGLARLQLFENFFLRSLEEQISTNFLCVIRTDPDLDDLVRQPLLAILEKSNLPQYLLIASNDNPHSHYLDITQDLSANQVWSGSWKEHKPILEPAIEFWKLDWMRMMLYPSYLWKPYNERFPTNLTLNIPLGEYGVPGDIWSGNTKRRGKVMETLEVLFLSNSWAASPLVSPRAIVAAAANKCPFHLQNTSPCMDRSKSVAEKITLPGTIVCPFCS